MGIRSQILDLIAPNSMNNPTINDVKELIEQSFTTKSTIRTVNNQSLRIAGTITRAERLATRKMMSRYWENTSIFALELGGAVMRQCIFVDKMHSLDWLHSPAAQNTMNRLLQKYARFITIIAQNPLHTAVPTLDVDLAWHTHQLFPKQYYTYTITTCKKFIDHDDKIDEDRLSTGFEWTSKTYEKLFGEVYSECTCWYCEAIRIRHQSSTAKMLGLSKHDKVNDSFYNSGTAQMCPPDNSAHISSHNSVHVEHSALMALTHERLRLRRKMEIDRAYDKACKRAAKKGRKPPPKEDYYYGKFPFGAASFHTFMAPAWAVYTKPTRLEDMPSHLTYTSQI